MNAGFHLLAGEIQIIFTPFNPQKAVAITVANNGTFHQVEAFRQKRETAIDTATRQELGRIAPDRFWKYLDDTTGDYLTIQQDIIAAISQQAGYPVELHDVIAAYKRVMAE
jgi:hypothetical protein